MEISASNGSGSPVSSREACPPSKNRTNSFSKFNLKSQEAFISLCFGLKVAEQVLEAKLDGYLDTAYLVRKERKNVRFKLFLALFARLF